MVLADAGDVGDVGIGHLAGRPQVPVIVTLARAAHVLREDMHFECDQGAVALAQRRRADELAAGDVGDIGPGHAHDEEVVRHLDRGALAVGALHGQGLTVEFFHRAAQPHRRIGRRLGEGNGRDGRQQKQGNGTNHGSSFRAVSIGYAVEISGAGGWQPESRSRCYQLPQAG